MQGQEVIEAIDRGELDGRLDDIREAISERRQVLGRRKHRQLAIGDTVRFVGLGMGAKYMNGETAVIVEINPKTVWVRLTPDSKARLAGTRFGRSSRIKVYPNSIEPAFIEGEARQGLPKLVNPDDLYVKSYRDSRGRVTHYNPDGSVKYVDVSNANPDGPGTL